MLIRKKRVVDALYELTKLVEEQQRELTRLEKIGPDAREAALVKMGEISGISWAARVVLEHVK